MIDDPDAVRMRLLRVAMDRAIVDVLAYPDESGPHWHIYVTDPELSPHPLFVSVFPGETPPGESLRKWVAEQWPEMADRLPRFRF